MKSKWKMWDDFLISLAFWLGGVFFLILVAYYTFGGSL